MKIAPKHAEAVSQRPRKCVEEGLLLDRIALHATHVAPRDVKHAIPVEAHLANPGLAFRNPAAVTAGKTLDESTFLLFVQVALANVLVQDLFQASHVGKTLSWVMTSFLTPALLLLFYSSSVPNSS